MLAESIVYEICTSGALAENVALVNGALRDRRDALVEALADRIPDARFEVPGGGYFLWLELSDDIDTQDVREAAGREGVAFIAGRDFMLEGGGSSLRLSFASVPADRIPEGVARIARALDSVRTASPA
jgi:2-aminoadipate transaminase